LDAISIPGKFIPLFLCPSVLKKKRHQGFLKSSIPRLSALDKRVASLSSGARHNKLDTIIPYRSMASKYCDKEINMPVRILPKDPSQTKADPYLTP
jgi:hypothetical protein